LNVFGLAFIYFKFICIYNQINNCAIAFAFTLYIYFKCITKRKIKDQAPIIKKIKSLKCNLSANFSMTKMPPLNKPPKPHEPLHENNHNKKNYEPVNWDLYFD
jgi:hypothetical protein